MSHTKIKTAIVGLGRAGWALHFEPLIEDPRFEIRAVVDPDPQRANEAKEKNGCTPFSNIDDLLEQGDVDLVIIATPNTMHFDDAMKVFAANKHCIIEKPMSLN